MSPTELATNIVPAQSACTTGRRSEVQSPLRARRINDGSTINAAMSTNSAPAAKPHCTVAYIALTSVLSPLEVEAPQLSVNLAKSAPANMKPAQPQSTSKDPAR